MGNHYVGGNKTFEYDLLLLKYPGGSEQSKLLNFVFVYGQFILLLFEQMFICLVVKAKDRSVLYLEKTGVLLYIYRKHFGIQFVSQKSRGQSILKGDRSPLQGGMVIVIPHKNKVFDWLRYEANGLEAWLKRTSLRLYVMMQGAKSGFGYCTYKDSTLYQKIKLLINGGFIVVQLQETAKKLYDIMLYAW
ncbi:hypothetical protein ACJX0J_009024 [Zea mays]